MTGRKPWLRTDPRRLAEYVPFGAERLLRLGTNRLDLQTQGGVRALAAAIYEILLQEKIEYDLEEYIPSKIHQSIRPPDEILRVPHRGTCLDLSVLFAGLCLDHRLIPILVILEDHALVAVSATHLLDSWAAPGRPGCDLYLEPIGPNHAPWLADQVNQGNLIAVECTGFARSEWLSRESDDYPETIGRVNGVMTFERAVAAGAEQLHGRRALRFAIDLAVARFRWNYDSGSPVQQPALCQDRVSTPFNFDISIARSFQRKINDFIDEYLFYEKGNVPFGGRDAELQHLTNWLFDLGAAPRMVVTAPAGRGKSSLLVHWRKSLLHHPKFTKEEWQLVFVPISIRHGTNRPSIFYGGLAQLLANITGQSLAPEAINNADVLKEFIRYQLEAAVPPSQRLLVVLDGLDEALHGSFDSSIIPRRLPSNLRLLVSARWQVGDTDSTGWIRKLGWDRNVRTEQMEPERLNSEAIVDVLLNLGAPTDVLAKEREIVDRLCELTEGKPILVRCYAEDLWQLGHQRARITIADLDTLTPGFSSYFERWLEHQEQLWVQEHYGIDRIDVDRILSILAFALGPLESRDLLDLVSEMHQTTGLLSEHRLLKPLRRFVIGNGRTGSGYVLSHPKIADFLQRERFGGRSILLRRGFATWGQKHLRRLNSGEIAPADASPYALQFLTGHFKDAGLSAQEWMELIENGWRRAWEQFEGISRGFASDVQAAWDVVRRDTGEARAIGTQWRCALVLSSVRSVGLNTPDALLCAAVALRRLSVRQAVHFAEMGRSDKDAVSLLLKLSRLDVLTPAQSSDLISTALENALSLGSERSRAHALELLASYLSPQQITEAFAAAKAINDEGPRAQLLASLALQLSLEHKTEAVAEALASAKSIDSEWSRAKVLGLLAPCLSPQQITEAFIAAKAISDAGSREQALGSLAAYLSPQQITEALAAAKTINDDGARARALGSLAAYLSPQQLTDALAAATAINSEGFRAEALGSLAPHLSPEQIAKALAAAKALHEGWNRGKVLASLAPHIPTEQIAELLASTKTIGDQRSRVEVLKALAPRLSRVQKTRTLAEALSIAKAIVEHQDRAWTLILLAPHLSRRQRINALNEALAAAKAIDKKQARAEALGSLAPYLSSEQKRKAITAGLAAAKDINDHSDSAARALLSLAPHLSPEQIAEAFAAAKAISSGWSRAQALGSLASLLSATQIAEALTAVKVVGDDGDRACVLGLLAPLLPQEQKTIALNEALAAAMAIDDREVNESNEIHQLDDCFNFALTRVGVLELLAPHLSPFQITDALTFAKAIDDDEDRARALELLAPHLLPEHIIEALAITKTIGARRHGARALGSLAPHLVPGCTAEALAMAKAMADDYDRASSLGSLAPHLSPHQITEEFATARLIGDDGQRVRALALLAPHLLPKQVAEAFAIVKAICVNERELLIRHQPLGKRDNRIVEYYCSKALGSFAPHLSPEQTAEALAVAKAIYCEESRALALGLLVPCLSPEQKAEALTAAKAIHNGRHRGEALASLAPHVEATQMAKFLAAPGEYRAPALGLFVSFLTPKQKAEAVADAITGIKDHEFFSQELRLLVPHLTREHIAEVLSVVNAIVDIQTRAIALSFLIPRLSPEEKTKTLGEALAAIRATGFDGRGIDALCRLVPHLSPEDEAKVLDEAITAIRATGFDRGGIETLSRLAPHLSPKQKRKALSGAIAALKEREEEYRAHNLESLAPHLSPEQKVKALAVIATIRNEEHRANALELLAPHLSPVATEALVVAKAIGDRWCRAYALGALTPHISSGYYTILLSSLTEAAEKLPRGAALHVVAASIQVSAALGGTEALEQIKRAISDTARWYP